MMVSAWSICFMDYFDGYFVSLSLACRSHFTLVSTNAFCSLIYIIQAFFVVLPLVRNYMVAINTFLQDSVQILQAETLILPSH